MALVSAECYSINLRAINTHYGLRILEATRRHIYHAEHLRAVSLRNPGY